MFSIFAHLNNLNVLYWFYDKPSNLPVFFPALSSSPDKGFEKKMHIDSHCKMEKLETFENYHKCQIHLMFLQDVFDILKQLCMNSFGLLVFYFTAKLVSAESV